VLKNKDSRANDSIPMRRVRAPVEVEGKERETEFLTNNIQWSASGFADLYRCRWQIEVFFKQIKQSLQSVRFPGQQRQRGPLAGLDGALALCIDAVSLRNQ
jgi:IS4 transposase